MKSRKVCAIIGTLSILTFAAGMSVMAEEQAETAVETEMETEDAETEIESETEDEMKIDRDHPEGRLSIPYDDPEVWDMITMPNDDTVDTGINIRATADADGEVLGYMYEGCAAWILDKGEEWTEIYTGGMTGFVKNEFMVYGEDVEKLAEKYGTSGITADKDNVYVFEAPYEDSEVVKVLRTGDDMFLVADDGEWLIVELNDEYVAYVWDDNVRRGLLLDAGVPKDGVYKDVEPSETSFEEEYYEEYVESEYSEPTYSEPTYTQPETQAPVYTQPETQAPVYTQPETQAPVYTQPETQAPETQAPETQAPETQAPETQAPETEAPAVEDPAEDDDSDEGIDIDTGDDGWYDADNDIYYDGDGNVISQDADTYTEETYAEETYVEDTYTEETCPEETYTEETYPEETYVEDTYTEETEVSASSDDVTLLAAIIYCEAGNQSYEGKVAVGAVVMNRVNSSLFPNTISEVIYQSGQFTPAYSGSLSSALANGVPDSCYEAAYAALAGENPVGDALYFNAGSGKGLQIGDHQFY